MEGAAALLPQTIFFFHFHIISIKGENKP